MYSHYISSGQFASFCKQTYNTTYFEGRCYLIPVPSSICNCIAHLLHAATRWVYRWSVQTHLARTGLGCFPHSQCLTDHTYLRSIQAFCSTDTLCYWDGCYRCDRILARHYQPDMEGTIPVKHKADLVTAAYTACCPVITGIHCLHQLHHQDDFHSLHKQQHYTRVYFECFTLASPTEAAAAIIHCCWLGLVYEALVTSDLAVAICHCRALCQMKKFRFCVAFEPLKSLDTNWTYLILVRPLAKQLYMLVGFHLQISSHNHYQV